jgi:integrase
MADDTHRKDQKLHNSYEKLHNCVGEEAGKEQQHNEETSCNYSKEGKPQAVVELENEAKRLAELPIDHKALFWDYVEESEARQARLAPKDDEELPPDPVSDYYLAIADHLQEIAKKAINRETIALTPQPIAIIPAPTRSSTQTHRGELAVYGDEGKKRLNVPEVRFERSELDQYVAYRSEGLAKKSLDWINRATEALWNGTQGQISAESMTALREFALDKYASVDSHRKVLGFAVAFLKFLAKVRFDPKIQSFEVYLDLPKAVRVRKAVTARIVRREDIAAVLQRIEVCTQADKIDPVKARNYRAFVLLAAYTGLRPSTIQRLTVGQVRAAISREKPVLHVLGEQEKNRVEHYVPLHPAVVAATSEVLNYDFGENDDKKPLFMFNSFEKWLERQRIQLSLMSDPTKAHTWLSDFRKFAEQFGDTIGWDSTNRKYILAHGMTGVDWRHYKHPLPEDVYNIYMQCWRDVDLTAGGTPLAKGQR